jgi:hypothetical protein
MDTVEADAMVRIANALEVAVPLLEKIRDDIREFTRVQSEAFELMKSREDEMRRAMSGVAMDTADIL